MDTHNPGSSTEPLDNEQVLNLWLCLSSQSIDTGSSGPGAISWPPQLWPSNTHSNLPASALENSAQTSPPLADMGTWGPSTAALHCYYPPVIAQDLQASSEEALDQNWSRVPQSHQRGLVPEWAEEMAAPGFNFRSYNNESPNELPTGSSIKVTGNDYVRLQYITQSHGNSHQQYFAPALEDPVRVTYVMSDTDGVGSHSMHMDAHSHTMPSQPFGQLEEHGLQSVIKPLSPRLSRPLKAAAPVVPGSESLLGHSVRLDPANMTQVLREETSGRSMAPLVTPYYNTSLRDPPSSPVCRVNPPYNRHTESAARSTDDYLQAQANSESPPQVSPSPGISAGHLQRAASTGCLHSNPVQSFRGQEQHFFGPPSPHIRWSYTEPSSPAEDSLAVMHRDRHRRSSLKTCELEEAGLDFPGCYVLVPTTEEPANSEATIIEGPEPGLISTKKNFRRPMVESERQAIKMNRKYGVCLRCKMFKERCRGGFPCERCRSLKLWKNICVTAHFTDKSIFSRGLYKARVSLMLENIRRWLPLEFHHQEVIEVSNGYPPKLSVTLQRFDPIDTSLLEHILWRELKKTDFARISSSPYGIIEDISSQFEGYFDSHIEHLINEIWRGVGTTVCFKIYAQTLLDAHRYTIDNKETGPLIRKTLRIWAAQIIFFKDAWRICGKNTVGMPTIDDPKSTVHGITPLPRLANQQLDAKVESWIADLEQEVLLELQQKIFRRNSADWFGIYLALFITLSSLERDTWGLRAWAIDADKLLERVKTLDLNRSVEVQKAWTWPLQEMPEMLDERNARLAETLAAHFRSITKGYIPFTLDWYSDPVISMVGREELAVDYMRNVGKLVRESDQILRARASALFSKEAFDSLNLMYCSKLLVSEDT